MADRRAELERKKQKLAMMREEKERRKREKEAKEAEELGLKNPKDLRNEADELLTYFNIPRISDLHSSTPTSLGTIEQTSSPTSDSSLSTASPSLPKSSSPQISTPKKCALTLNHVTEINIPPKEKVLYSKQTQTQPPNAEKEAHPLDYYVLTYADLSVEDDDLPVAPKPAGLPNVEMVRPAHTPDPGDPAHTSSGGDQTNTKEDKPKKVIELSEEEKQQIMMREDFHHFFDRTTRIIERALFEKASESDILIDYSGGGDDQDGDDKSGMKLSLTRYFFDDHWSKNRTVTSFDWSTQFPELLVASYNNNEESPHDPDGVCLVWNMKFKKTTPEFVFHCQSPVMCASFAKFHPNLVVGGTYSGQICLWDNRSAKRTPVQRSPLSAAAHTHPVYCVQVVGTQNAHNLVSVSTDGKFCTWSLDMLSSPQETMELSNQKQSCVAVTCLSFPAGDFNNFVVGSEEDVVYSGCRHGSKAGVVDVFEGHMGPVTGIDCHSAQGPVDFSHLFLSSSIDWTVKLWTLKEPKPLYSFEHTSDYVYDVRWSPIHPALFASVDGTGRLDLWNLNLDTELPTISTVVDRNPALNRVIWTPSGHQVAIGDDMGKIWIYDVGEQLASPKADEWTKLVHTLQELKNNQADQDLDLINNGINPIR